MLRKLNKQYFPFVYLVLISISWSYVYSSSSWINDLGSSKSEWLLLIDGLIVLPLLCFVCIKDKEQAILKTIIYSSLIVLLGSLIIPEENKLIWRYLELARYFLIAGFVAVEIYTITSLVSAIRHSIHSNIDPDESIERVIFTHFGNNIFTQFLAVDARMWSYLLFFHKIKTLKYDGQQHFFCHLKDGAQSNQLGYIFMILLELPIVHLFLHFTWSPFAATITSALTILGLLFFIAEYRALSFRPCSLCNKGLVIRYGLWNTVKIKYENITAVEFNNQPIKRKRDIKRFNLSGVPNVKIQLNTGKIKSIYLGLNEPAKFIELINGKLG